MGKRSDFARNPRDFYPTPIEAVVPLIPHLPIAATFADPCAGDGQLVGILNGYGCGCCTAIDIKPQHWSVFKGDALEWTAPPQADLIITNPPWDRKILHPMIEHFSAMRPSWLLIDGNWAHTTQSAHYMRWCQKTVSAGSAKWVPGGKYTDRDKCYWYLFDQHSEAPCQFVGRAA